MGEFWQKVGMRELTEVKAFIVLVLSLSGLGWPSGQVHCSLSLSSPLSLWETITLPSPHPLLSGDANSHAAPNSRFLHILFGFLTLCLHL